MDHSPPGFSVYGILQARILEWVPCPPPEDLSNPGIEPSFLMSPTLAGGFFTTDATWEAQDVLSYGQTKSTSVPVDCNWIFSTNSCTFCISKSSQVLMMLLVGNHTLRITALKYGYLIRLRVFPFLWNKSQTNGSAIVWFPAPGSGGGNTVAGEWERVALSGERSPSITSHR